MSDSTVEEQAAVSASPQTETAGSPDNVNASGANPEAAGTETPPDPPVNAPADAEPAAEADGPPEATGSRAEEPAATPVEVSVEEVEALVTEPAAEPMSQPMTEPISEPVAEPVVEPVAESAAEPLAAAAAVPVAESVTESTPEPVTEPEVEGASETPEEGEKPTTQALASSGPSAPVEEPQPSTSKALPPDALSMGRMPAESREPPPPYSDSKDSPTALLTERRHEPFDEEASVPKLKYPKSVFFIISNEFCERFSYYGMRTILVLYLTSILMYNEDDATVIYHVFAMFCYFFPILGSMIADSWLGKFKTIFFLSIVYAIGNIIISLASASSTIDVPGRELTIVGLLLIAFGTGGIKPCVSAFGGDQFILPQQEKQMAQFFSLFYFAINSGSLVSTFLTPVLREDVQCLDQSSCYPLAFGVPAVLMVVSIIVFVAGKNLYIIKKPQGNVVMQVSKCMGHAVGQKIRSKGPKRDHWLDYADDKYEKKQIEDIKSALRVLYLYLPLPFFWALFDQQGSRWTFQATMMTGSLGSWSLKPDQMQVVNPLLILIFIPIFESIIYPLLKKCNLLTKPLQRLGVGGVLAAIAFAISAVVELQLEDSYPLLPGSGQGQLRIFNGIKTCAVEVNMGTWSQEIPIYESWRIHPLEVNGDALYNLKWKETCTENSGNAQIRIKEKQIQSFLITEDGLKSLSYEENGDTVEKTKEVARIRVLFNDLKGVVTIGQAQLENKANNGKYGQSDLVDLTPNTYEVKHDGKVQGHVELKVGGVYTVILPKINNDLKVITITPENNVHMLWLIPQYVVMTMGEVMFSITGLEFSYSQSPLSMKSVMQAGWLLTVAFGNLIVVIIAEAKFFDRQLWEFVLFAGLMVVDMLIFALMAMGYQYIAPPHEDQDLPLESTEEKRGIDNANFKRDDE